MTIVIKNNTITSHIENGMIIRTSYNNVYNNYISNSEGGISIWHHRRNKIYNNYIKDCDFWGINIALNTRQNFVFNNHIYRSNSAIQITESTQNYIYNNHIEKNSRGIDFYDSTLNLIRGNTILRNGYAGLNITSRVIITKHGRNITRKPMKRMSGAPGSQPFS